MPSAVTAASPSTSVNADDTQERNAIKTAAASARLLVEAGPGTGKTEMAALRLSGLIRSELSPGQMLVLSFSRSAVRTLTNRLGQVAKTDPQDVEELRHVSIRTFDSWTFRMLRLLGCVPSSLLAREHDENIAELTELILGPRKADVRALIGDRRHLIVDEFQDLPGVRGELVLALLSLMAPPDTLGCGFTILGDPAQAIYGFAGRAHSPGAYPTPSEYWKRVRTIYGAGLQVRTLTRNYRAVPSLAKLSSDLRTVLLSDRAEREKLQVVRDTIAAFPDPADSFGPGWLAPGQPGSRAILTRTNGEALRVLQKLIGTSVEGPATAVRLRAGSYSHLPPAWIGAMLRKLRAATLTRSQFSRIYALFASEWDEDTRQTLGTPPDGAAWTRLAVASGAPEDATTIELAELRRRINWPDSFPDDQQVWDDGLIVTTIHQSKGLEFDIVTVLDGGQEEEDDENEEEPTDQEKAEEAGEEANVAYVAVTRAGLELNRITPGQLYKAPTNWLFSNGRRRLCYWRRGWINMEMGQRGDLDPFGFVDPALHGDASAVNDLQAFLLRGARGLDGHKVMLRKHSVSGKVLWHIHLQEASGLGRLIGRTAPQLTFDLLHILHNRGYSLPNTIMNLRIAAVGTITAEGELALEEPDRSSRLWLGVSLFGTGDFKTFKAGRK